MTRSNRLTYSEAAAALRVSERTLHRWARAGVFEPQYVKARVFIRAADVRRIAKKREVCCRGGVFRDS